MDWRIRIGFVVGITVLLLAGCGDSTNNKFTETDGSLEQNYNPGVIARIDTTDLKAGFEEINFYHDVPGLLLESNDPVLSGLGSLARESGRSDGQGFANAETGELLFAITIAMNSMVDAEIAFNYIASQPLETIFQFISPDEKLFESTKLPAPKLGESTMRYSLRYGSEDTGKRIRDVATDLIIFIDGGSLIFVLQSVNTAAKPILGENEHTTTLGRAISNEIAKIKITQKAQLEDNSVDSQK